MPVKPVISTPKPSPARLVKWYNGSFVMINWGFDSLSGHHPLLPGNKIDSLLGGQDPRRHRAITRIDRSMTITLCAAKRLSTRNHAKCDIDVLLGLLSKGRPRGVIST